MSATETDTRPRKRRPFFDYCMMYVVVLLWSFLMTALILPEASHALYGTTTDVPTARYLQENMSVGYFGILILYYVSASIQLVTVVAMYALIGFAVPIVVIVCIARRKI